MKKWNLKIGMQMAVGFAVVLALVIVLSTVSYTNTQSLYEQAQQLYQHPLQVRQAVNQLKIDVLNTRVGIRDLLLAPSEQVKESAARTIQSSLEEGEGQFDIIYNLYLGPVSDVDAAYSAYNDWRGATEYRASLAQHGLITSQSVADDSTVGAYREQLLSAIGVIERFANNKADELYASFISLNNIITIQIFVLCAAILALTVIISGILTRAVRRPLLALNESITKFHRGDLSVRSTYVKNNEFGVLTESFNTMADSLQKNINLNAKSGRISDVMLTTENAHEFFRNTLGELAEQTGAHMAAAYLYESETKAYRHYESVGLNGEAKESFDAEGLEGLFGPAALTGKLQIIRDIPQDTKLAFQSPCCRFIPRELITIPISSGRQTIAVICLACVGAFREDTQELLETILPTMSARVEGVLAFRTIRRFSGQMEEKNRELDVQKEELAAQATELAHQNAELEIQKKQLEEAGRLKTSFLSNMSHELRTPLNSIIALSGVLNRRLRDKIPGEEYEYLDVIERNGKSLLALINEILDISRIEAGREEVEATSFSMKGLLAEIAGILRPQAEQKGVKLLLNDKAPDVAVTSDAGKCRHILMNVIGNAVKFTEKGKVKVSLSGKKDAVEIAVSDTGVGIPPEHLPHIFNEFRQADGGTARRFGGTGLGLSIAMKYTQLLGGTIAASSTLGKGSLFTVLLPLKYEGPAVQGGAGDVTEQKAFFVKEQDAAMPGVQKTVLLIEDSEPQIIQIKDLISETGNRILIARSAAQAFEILKTEAPDGIILDLMMPEVDGFETLKVLRETPGTLYTPVLILTAKHITKDELKFLKQNHIYQLIRKGDVDRAELLKSVSAMLCPQPTEKQKFKMKKESKPLVLVVEDNPDNMITVKALLSENYRVLGAEDGEKGVEAAKENVPDLVLMDIELPGMSGIEAYKEIRKKPELNSVHVIALTASAMEEERETILAYGFDAFIAKPIVAAEFYKVIGEVLNGR